MKNFEEKHVKDAEIQILLFQKQKMIIKLFEKI